MPSTSKNSRPVNPISGLELARKLGVSHATVSYVLNGVAEKRRISPKTIRRVQEAAIQFNCSLNRAARSLKGSRSGMIGIVIGNLKMDWAESVMNAIQGVFDGTDLVPFIATHNFDSVRNRREIISSLQRRDEGIITFPLAGCEDIYESLIQAKMPLVFLADEFAELTGLVSSVMWDPRPAVREAVQHLAALGKKKIAFLGIDYRGLGTLHRFKAFQESLKEVGIPLNRKWVATPPASQSPEEIVGIALNQFFANDADKPDAIFCLNDGLALPALEMIENEHRFSVPGQVAVIGMGNLPLAGHPRIGLTTLPEPIADMSALAASLILDLMEGRVKAPVRKSVSTNELLIRRTTAGP